MSDMVPARYIVLIQFDKTDDSLERLGEAATGIKNVIEQVSKDEYDVAFTSADGKTMGFVMKSGKHPNVIRAALETNEGTRRGDSFLVLELGEQMGGIGFSRCLTWLQHH